MNTIPPLGSPNSVDLHVGARVRARRKALGMSQEQLAQVLGLTFQQVQKYERGANRISASKLYDIARALHTSVVFFFEGLAETAPIDSGSNTADCLQDLAMLPEGSKIAQYFPQLRSGAVRREVVALVRTLVEMDN